MEDFLSMLGMGGDTGGSTAMVSPYPDASGVAGGSPGDMVNPYPISAGGGAIDPAMQSYLHMLGIPNATAGASPMTAPQMTQPTTQPGTQLPPGMLAPFLGLGISGQKAQEGMSQMAGGGGASTNYALPANPGGSTGKGTGTASIPITALIGMF